MAPIEQDRAENIKRFVSPDQRIGLTEFARSKNWRKNLLDYDILEIVDHADTAAYLVSPEGMQDLLQRLNTLEEEIEQMQVDALFAERKNRNDWSSGEDLARKAKNHIASRLEGLLDGD